MLHHMSQCEPFETVSSYSSCHCPAEVGDNEFCASTPWTPYGQSVKHMFGGQAVGQALMAAGRTLRGEHAGKLVNSLHAYFLRAANLTSPITYKVCEASRCSALEFYSKAW